MHIEIIGPTSAGKTTLAKSMVENAHSADIDIQMSEDFLLDLLNLNWIKNGFLRRRVVEIWALLVCIGSWRKHHRFYKFALSAARKIPGTWFYKLNRARNAVRKIGIFEIIQNYKGEKDVILVDNEGVLQGVHNLYVHTASKMDAVDLSAFVELIPLPDIVVYIQVAENELVNRTLNRGHDRVTKNSKSSAYSFINQATQVFEELADYGAVVDRLIIVDLNQNVCIATDKSANSIHFQAKELIKAGILALAGDHKGGFSSKL